MRVSVAMATYNGERFLQEQLESFLNQRTRPDELVVSDDASTDGTANLVDEFKRIAPFDVKLYVNSVNVGYKRNFENAIQRCTGEIVFLCDQDDVWLPEKIASHIRVYQDNVETQVVISDQHICDADLKPAGVTKLGNIRAAGLSDDNFITGCCTSLRREFASFTLPIPDVCSNHDGWINLAAVTLESRVVLPEPLQHFRRHGSNASHSPMSQPVRPGIKYVLGRYRFSDGSSGWRRQRETFQELRSRIWSKEHCLSAVAPTKIESAGRVLGRKIENLDERLSLVGKGRIQRIPSLFRFFLRGGYQDSRGFQSFVKDVFT